MLKPFVIVSAIVLFGVAAYAQDAPAAAPAPSQPGQASVPADYASKVNPVKPTSESQARAKKMYGWDCAMCHGDNGDGKGDVASEQKLTMRDYRDPASLKAMSDGEIFYIIQKGKGQMPAEGDRAKTEEIWNLVIYLRKMATPGFTASAAPTQ